MQRFLLQNNFHPLKKISACFLILFILPVTLFAAQGASSIKLIQAKGTVNTREIGGERLSVFSLWDKQKYSPVLADGSFYTTISGSRPQKISLNDARGQTRALAIVVPEESERIIFDAKSTARAILFQDPALFKDSRTAENYFSAMENKKSFQALVLFFKQKLGLQSLEELNQDPECTALLETCSSEIFGDDPAAIRSSLQKAKERLEELF